MAYDHIIYEYADNVAIARFNDPATLNAMSVAMGEELRHALRRAQTEARALIIGGVGNAFSSGANMGDGGLDVTDPSLDIGLPLEQTFNPLALEMRASTIPIVTAIRGPAAGVGCAIALSGDIIVAGENAYFFQAFRHIGLAPDGGSSYLLAKAVGRVRAMEMMLLGTKLKAPTALQWGMITRVVPDDDVDGTALTIATELARGPVSLGMIRACAWAALDAPMDQQLATERAFQSKASRTADFREGVAAFQQKRPAKFTGQ